MKTLREAKAALADTPVMTHAANRLHDALAALVEEIEAAPVYAVTLIGGPDTLDYLSIELDEDGLSEFHRNQRVRVLAVGEGE